MSQAQYHENFIKLKKIIKKISHGLPCSHAEFQINENMNLKTELMLDSFALMELVVLVHEEWQIDLGEKSLQGKQIATVANILTCLED